MNKFFQTIANIFRFEELRNRILLTIGFIAIYRLGSFVVIPGINPETDRMMICGSMEMLKDTQAILDAAGLSRGSSHAPGNYTWEKAFSG